MNYKYIKRREGIMGKINEEAEERRIYLVQLKNQIEKGKKKRVQGKLRVCSRGDRFQYYRRNAPTDFNGSYISKENIQIAKDIAQQDYNEQLLKALQEEVDVLNKFLQTYPAENVEKVYEKLHKGRKKLVTPWIEPEEDFLNKWQEYVFQGLGYTEDTPEFYTQRGERVRSKSELIIADMLEKEKIPYRYECPIFLKGYGKVYPDFTVLNIKKRKEFYWEHLGMMDDHVYAENAIRKIKNYEQNGYCVGLDLILTFESKNVPINQKQIANIIERFLK